MAFSPFPTLQQLNLRDPSLFIGEGGGVGGKGGGRADDPTAFDDFGNYGLDSPASTVYGGEPVYDTGYNIGINVLGDLPTPQIGTGDYSVRNGGLDIITKLQRAAEQNRLESILSGDLPYDNTGYNIDINVLGDLVRGLTGNRGMGQGATQTPTVAKAPPEEAKKKEVEFDPNLRAGGGSALFLEQLPQKTAEKADIDPAQRYVDPTKLFLEELRQGLSQLAQNTPRVAFRNNQWIDNMTGDEVDIIDAQTGRSIV